MFVFPDIPLFGDIPAIKRILKLPITHTIILVSLINGTKTLRLPNLD